MFRSYILSLLMFLVALALPAYSEDRTPAGYVVDVELAGADQQARTVIVRAGAELEAKLMMPLFDGDVVFVREVGSRVELELGPGTHVTVGGNVPRFSVEGEITTGDGGWDLLSAVAGVFAGEGEQAPENMVSKGGSLKAPMAVRGVNHITGRESLWLAWQGGKAPYSVALESDGTERLLAEELTESQGRFVLATSAQALPERILVVVKDAEGQALRIRFRVARSLPEGVAVQQGGGVSQALIAAAQLTAIRDGAWSIEAAQVAGETGAGQELRRRIAAGWRLEPRK